MQGSDGSLLLFCNSMQMRPSGTSSLISPTAINQAVKSALAYYNLIFHNYTEIINSVACHLPFGMATFCHECQFRYPCSLAPSPQLKMCLVSHRLMELYSAQIYTNQLGQNLKWPEDWVFAKKIAPVKISRNAVF